MPRDLSIGMTGDDVSAIQGLLNFHLAGLDEYFPLRRDGTFGSKTYAALTKFQSLNLLWMAATRALRC